MPDPRIRPKSPRKSSAKPKFGRGKRAPARSKGIRRALSELPEAEGIRGPSKIKPVRMPKRSPRRSPNIMEEIRRRASDRPRQRRPRNT